MGYAKYFEDNQDIVIARTEHIHAVSIAPVPVPHYVCPYCNQVEYSQLKLFNHIKAEHNITHPVIIINGKVVNEPEYNVARIDELRVFTYGFADKISLSQKQFLQSETASVDLTMEAQEALDAETSVELRVGERSLFIKKFSVKELRNEKINPIIREWARPGEYERIRAKRLYKKEKRAIKGQALSRAERACARKAAKDEYKKRIAEAKRLSKGGCEPCA